jgi:BMFP domain-containing protein YqiC
MAQSSRIFDSVGRMMNDAAGVADGVRREIETLVRAQAERFVMDMNLVKREDYDALRELVQAQAAELKALKADVAALKGDGKPAKP